MAVKMNLWSMTLLPGEKYPMLVRRDFQITNVALGEELRDENGRSVVKVTHNPIDPAAFDTDSEIDSDFDDSDDEFDMDGEDSVDEEVDDEEEVDVEAKKKVKAVAKEALKAAEDAEMDEDDEDEDEDEEDDEELDSDDEEALEVNVICSLLAGKVEQAQVNLTFVEGEVVMFEASGENAVHLLGNYIDQFPDVDSDSEFDSDEDDYDDYSALYDDEDDEDESGPEIEELEEEAEVEVKPKKAIKAAAAAPAAKEEKAAPTSLKRKSEAVESPAGKTAEAAAAASGEGLSKAQKKKLAKKAKLDGADAAPAPAAAAEKPKPKAQNAPQKRTTASGLIIEDITVGTGPVAKGGKRLGMRYIGKLTSGKQFDANTAGKPFSFVLGRGEVIKGWDEGLVGMAVGGERRLTIPPQLAYGKRASGPIPANSTLKFDVKLVSIN